jgi:hypothetical protein
MAKTKAATKRETSPAKPVTAAKGATKTKAAATKTPASTKPLTRQTPAATAKKAPVSPKPPATAATPEQPAAFRGFPPDLFQLLAELGLDNEREWSEPRKRFLCEAVGVAF